MEKRHESFQALRSPSAVPASLEWLPENHLARFIIEVTDQLDLTSHYSGKGSSEAYHPAMMLALLVYGYA